MPIRIRPSRGWITVILGVGALPAAWAGRLVGLDDHAVFAACWTAATLVQLPPREHRYDAVAVAAVGLYLLSFVLPAGVGAAAGHVAESAAAGVGVHGASDLKRDSIGAEAKRVGDAVARQVLNVMGKGGTQ